MPLGRGKPSSWDFLILKCQRQSHEMNNQNNLIFSKGQSGQQYNNPPVHVGNFKHNLLAQYLDRANAKPSNITVFSQSYLEQAGSYLKGSLRTILRSEVSTGASRNVSRHGQNGARAGEQERLSRLLPDTVHSVLVL